MSTTIKREYPEEKPEEKPKNKKYKSSEEEEEELCSICHNDLNDEKKPVITLTDPNNKTICNHKFHEECINGWMTSNNKGSKQCPLCRTPINVNHIAAQQQNPRIHLSVRRLKEIEDYQIAIGSPVPFLGIVFCYNNKIFKQLLNIEIDFTTNNTLGELKERILHIQDDIIAELPYDFTCIARNVASTITRGVIQPSNRTIQIENIHFTTPSKCRIPGFSNRDFNNNNNMKLGTLYKLYQEEAFRAASDTQLSASDKHSIRNVYNNFVYTWEPTKPYELGYFKTDFFVNPDGPELPIRFRAKSDSEKSSRYSIAWIGIDIGCNRSGGKTRKKQFRKRNKSNKRKSNTPF